MRATTSLLSVAGRRLSCSSASAMVWREVSGHHKLTIDGCTPVSKKPWDWSVTSKTFEAAGYNWKITYYPNGQSWVDDDYISLYLDLDCHRQTEQLDFKFTLLDQAGNPVPKYSRSKRRCSFNPNLSRFGFHNFVKWKDLEESGCLKDDRFDVQCDITVIKDWTENNNGADDVGGDGAPARVVVPPSDLHEHLNNLLWKKQGTDVVIYVGGEAVYEAHGWLLAARSPVFEAELLGAIKEKVPGDVFRQHMEIQGVEPKVFKAMLHFMYTDTLPDEMEECDTVEMTRGLLVAVHRYKLERLKLMCEEILCKHVNVDTVASSLAVADQHGCGALKAACMEFMAVPGNLKAVMETDGFKKTKAKSPAVLMEFVMKQLA